jgi:hypothetical protein
MPQWQLPHRVARGTWPRRVRHGDRPDVRDRSGARAADGARRRGTDAALTTRVAALLRADALRAYASDDLPASRSAARSRTCFAIAAGASDGLGFGDNARAALITRGLAESGGCRRRSAGGARR